MKIIKESQGGQETEVSPEDLALINQLARKELKAEEVYTFSPSVPSWSHPMRCLMC